MGRPIAILILLEIVAGLLNGVAAQAWGIEWLRGTGQGLVMAACGAAAAWALLKTDRKLKHR